MRGRISQGIPQTVGTEQALSQLGEDRAGRCGAHQDTRLNSAGFRTVQAVVGFTQPPLSPPQAALESQAPWPPKSEV